MSELNNIANKPVKKVIVCFISPISNQAKTYILNKLKHLDNIQLLIPQDTSKEILLNLVPNADILIGWRPPKKLLTQATKMKLFINPGAGIHHLLELFRELNEDREILLINGHGNSYFVAQHAVALLLTLMNKIIPHHQWMVEGKWRTGDKEDASIPLRFKNVGLLGYGAINQKVHHFLAGFNVEFSILRKHWDKQKSQLPTKVKKYEYYQLHEFLKKIDVLMNVVPVTSLTMRMIKSKELELLGPNGMLINVARGEIIDEKSLFLALKNQIIAGAAIDVWYDYHPKQDEKGRKYPYHFPFHELDNIILSPHRGYSPFSDLLRWNEVVENITRMANGRKDFINIVNLNEEY